MGAMERIATSTIHSIIRESTGRARHSIFRRRIQFASKLILCRFLVSIKTILSFCFLFPFFFCFYPPKGMEREESGSGEAERNISNCHLWAESRKFSAGHCDRSPRHWNNLGGGGGGGRRSECDTSGEQASEQSESSQQTASRDRNQWQRRRGENEDIGYLLFLLLLLLHCLCIDRAVARSPLVHALKCFASCSRSRVDDDVTHWNEPCSENIAPPKHLVVVSLPRRWRWRLVRTNSSQVFAFRVEQTSSKFTIWKRKKDRRKKRSSS